MGNLFSSLQERLGLSAPTPSQSGRGAINDLNKARGLNLDAGAYQVNPANWYSAKPYGFRLNTRAGKQFTMFLPINPSNINIITNFATNIIPTLYGTVEEHSDIRYYDIVIEGTTGMAPKFVSPIDTTPSSAGATSSNGANNDASAYNSLQQPGRAKYSINSPVPLGGFFSSTIGQITNVLNQANKAVSAIGGLFGAEQAQPETGLYVDQTGYMAFHNLYRFLKKYKQDASGLRDDGTPGLPAPSRHPLTFFNYKDGNEYDVAIRSFVLRKSADNPMLYFYSITMRAYNIRSSGESLPNEDINQRLKDLGLDGVKSSSLLSTIKSISGNAKAVVGSVVNGASLLGR
jgi:hypothetical protein